MRTSILTNKCFVKMGYCSEAEFMVVRTKTRPIMVRGSSADVINLCAELKEIVNSFAKVVNGIAPLVTAMLSRN